MSSWLDRRYTIPGLIGAAFLIRLAALYVHPIRDALYSDMGNYVAIAGQLRSGPWRATHFFQPIGFPSIVLVFRTLFSDWSMMLGLYQVAISTATVWLVAHVARTAFGPSVALLTAVVAAFHVSWVVLTTVALPETTFTFLLAVLSLVTLKVLEHRSLKWSVLWGIVFYVTFIVKGSHGFFGPLFLLGILIWKRWSRDALLKIAVPISAVVGTGLLLHGALTYRAIGSFEMLPTEGGLNFVEGKCPYKRNFDSTGRSWFSPLYHQLGRTEAKRWDRPFTDHHYFMNEGLKCIRENPWVLATSLEGIPFLFVANTLWPASRFSTAPVTRTYDLVFGVWLIVGLALGYRLLWRTPQRGPALIAWALPFVGLCLTVYIFKSEIRFRIPFDVWLIPVAVHGWMAMFRNRRDDSPSAVRFAAGSSPAVDPLKMPRGARVWRGGYCGGKIDHENELAVQDSPVASGVTVKEPVPMPSRPLAIALSDPAVNATPSRIPLPPLNVARTRPLGTDSSSGMWTILPVIVPATRSVPGRLLPLCDWKRTWTSPASAVLALASQPVPARVTVTRV